VVYQGRRYLRGSHRKIENFVKLRPRERFFERLPSARSFFPGHHRKKAVLVERRTIGCACMFVRFKRGGPRQQRLCGNLRLCYRFSANCIHCRSWAFRPWSSAHAPPSPRPSPSWWVADKSLPDRLTHPPMST